LRIEGMPMLLAFMLAGASAAVVGVLFGLPSLRIKGFYLAVATLAAQFFVVWALTKFPGCPTTVLGRDHGAAADLFGWRSTRR
jgi:ABC-type branched-subunit amino acid transport system permease subunit